MRQNRRRAARSRTHLDALQKPLFNVRQILNQQRHLRCADSEVGDGTRSVPRTKKSRTQGHSEANLRKRVPLSRTRSVCRAPRQRWPLARHARVQRTSAIAYWTTCCAPRGVSVSSATLTVNGSCTHQVLVKRDDAIQRLRQRAHVRMLVHLYAVALRGRRSATQEACAGGRQARTRVCFPARRIA